MSLRGADFVLLWIAASVAATLGTFASMREDRTQHNMLAFDLIRAATVTAYGWVAVATCALAVPHLFEVTPSPPTALRMAPETALLFALLALGACVFFWFRLQAQAGSHPWQRQSIAEVVADTRNAAPPP